MVSFYPENAKERLEFHKITALLLGNCRTEGAKKRVSSLNFLSRKESIERALLQTAEYKSTLSSDHFPNEFEKNVEKQLKLLQIPGAALSTEDLHDLRALATNFRRIHDWFKGKHELFPNLYGPIQNSSYEKEISRLISAVLDDLGQVKDNASAELLRIRTELDAARHRLKRVFDNTLRRYAKLGYLADAAESFLNGRRTLSVLAEYKRIVKGIIHGSSDTQKTFFIEPESTIELNNEIATLQQDERAEIRKVLMQTTAELVPFHTKLHDYYRIAGIYDFIRAKALLAEEMGAQMPRISEAPRIHLFAARHPLLLLQNNALGKETVPLEVSMDNKNRILMISGPNAGGKTVAMKTIGLLQLMAQAGLLVPVDEKSEMGIFRKIMVHIGDTQSIENELSTYSAHLQDMKSFTELADGKSLFFIDELGSGSDPNLGGAFAEAIVETLASKKAFGIITTHYLNLKTMAGKIPGIFNGAMAFDETHLRPLYQLTVGKPGSSYTFAIAKRSGLSDKIISRAREITDAGHFKLETLLRKTEQQYSRIRQQEQQLNRLLAENERIKKKYEELTDKEKLKQHYATLKLQNAIKKEELDYLRDMERKFKQIIQDWKKAENKQEVIRSAEQILFRKRQIQQNAAAAKKADKRYKTTGETPEIGDLVRHSTNHQVGRVVEINDKKAIIQIGKLPFTVTLNEWVVVQERRPSK